MVVEEALYEVGVLFGLPYPVLLGILALVMFIAFGSFIWLNLGASWGFLLGVIPVAFGVLLGIFPMYLIFICLGLGGIVYFSNLLWSKNYSEEDNETTEIVGIAEIPEVLGTSKVSPSKRKPPWAK